MGDSSLLNQQIKVYLSFAFTSSIDKSYPNVNQKPILFLYESLLFQFQFFVFIQEQFSELNNYGCQDWILIDYGFSLYDPIHQYNL